MPQLSELLLITGVLVLLSTLTSKLSERIGVPALLMFVGVGMLAGSDGLGGLYFHGDQAAAVANAVGTVALAYILFSGGMDTSWQAIRPVLGRGIVLSTVGVVISALVLGALVHWILGVPFKVSLLLASIVSCTDAAAVFAVLRSHGASLKGNLRPLLEFESGSNDPVAIFLTIGLIHLIKVPEASWVALLPSFAIEMSLGTAMGVVAGRLAAILLNRVHLDYDGLYPVLGISLVVLVFGAAQVAGGNGFLAVYVCGIMLGHSDFMHKRTMMRFHDGVGWLMQIGMFLVLGLLVFPSHLPGVIGVGLLVSAILMFIARPVSVYLCLLGSKFTWREQTVVAWTGLRGAVPIVLATFPMMEHTPKAETIFNVVFFVVLLSVLLQGRSMMTLARWLKVAEPGSARPRSPLEFDRTEAMEGETREFDILPDSVAVGKRVAELDLPPDVLILLIRRGRRFVVPRGQTVIEPYDTLMVLAEPESLRKVRPALETRAVEAE